jgi:hypothetical protein
MQLQQQKKILCKLAKAPILQSSKKELVYIAIACAVSSVNWSCQGMSLRWPGPKSCFQRASRGGAESDFAHREFEACRLAFAQVFHDYAFSPSQDDDHPNSHPQHLAKRHHTKSNDYECVVDLSANKENKFFTAP